MTFERIKALREAAGETQNTLAELLFIALSIYSDYENGKLEIPVEALSKIADHYHTSIDYLVERTNLREPYPSE